MMASGRARPSVSRTCRFVGDVEARAIERHDLVMPALLHDRSAELPAGADHGDAHHAAFSPSAANARICSSSSTPSQRATTAVAMQLPITLTAVRPMSMI